MCRIIGILLSSVLFFLLFQLFGLTPKAVGGPECGFFYGLAHGYIAIPSFIVKLIINDNQAIIAPLNNGLGYGAGFLIGFLFLGGISFIGGKF
jgi:hypothetical protein